MKLPKLLADYCQECDECGRGPMWWERLELWHQYQSRRWFELWHPRIRRQRQIQAAMWSEKALTAGYSELGRFNIYDYLLARYKQHVLASTIYRTSPQDRSSVYDFPYIEDLKPHA